MARHRDSADSDQAFEHWLAERARKREKEEELSRRYERTVQEFEANTFDMRKAQAALGDIDISTFRELMRRGLLREVVPPERPRDLIPLRYIGSGPFFDRDEVLALSREMLDADERLPMRRRGRTAHRMRGCVAW